MGFSQLGDVHFLKGVPGWSWTRFLIDFRVSGEASGDHLRPPLGDFGRPWGHFGRRGGVTLAHFGSIGVTSRGLWGHFVVFGGRFRGPRPHVYHFFAKYADSFKEFVHCSVHGSSRVE